MIDWDDLDSATWWQLHDRATKIGVYVQDRTRRIKLGVYDEDRDGDLLAVLEEIERILR